MAKKAAKGIASKGSVVAKKTLTSKAKKAGTSKPRVVSSQSAGVKAKSAAAAKSRPTGGQRAAAPASKPSNVAGPPSTDILRGYKSRLLGAYIGQTAAGSKK